MGHLQARRLPRKPPKKQKKAEDADEEEDDEEDDEEEVEEKAEEGGAAAAAPRSAVMQLAQASYWCDYIDSLDLVAPQQHTVLVARSTARARRRAAEDLDAVQRQRWYRLCGGQLAARTGSALSRPCTDDLGQVAKEAA
jgi:hypothetical protein